MFCPPPSALRLSFIFHSSLWCRFCQDTALTAVALRGCECGIWLACLLTVSGAYLTVYLLVLVGVLGSFVRCRLFLGTEQESR